MSKSKGNVIDPWTVLDTRGADALRWNFFSAGSPWTPRRVSVEAIDESARFLVTLWNTYSFFVTYANLDGWTPGTDASASTAPTSRARPVGALTSAPHGRRGHRRRSRASTRCAARRRSTASSTTSRTGTCVVHAPRFWNAERRARRTPRCTSASRRSRCCSRRSRRSSPTSCTATSPTTRRVGAPGRLARGRRRRARRRARGRDGAGPRGRVARPVGPQRGQAQGAPAAATRARAAARAVGLRFSDAVAAEVADALNVKQLEAVTDLEGLLEYSVSPTSRRWRRGSRGQMPLVKDALARAPTAAR